MNIPIAVCGAGTMGSGIAQVFAQHGYEVILFDLQNEALKKAADSIQKNLVYLTTKKKIAAKEKTDIFSRITFTNEIEKCTAFIVVEAIAEVMEAKIELFKKLATINNEEVIFVSNTSSLSISALQKEVPYPQRVAGMHFFNPPYIMPLVEIVRGSDTRDEIIRTLVSVCHQLQKHPIVCNDSPGFIVNRVARPYYLESLRLLENEVADIAEIDDILEATGFKMGPFRLMDLIGIDINLATSQSVYESLGRSKRLEPSAIQAQKVANGELGKKTGKGFYPY